MKKFIGFAVSIVLTVGGAGSAFAVSLINKMCAISNTPVGANEMGYVYSTSCKEGTMDSACDMCSSTTTNNGVVSTTSGNVIGNFSGMYGDTVTCSCSLNGTTSKCASGYYGTATSMNSGCTKCPSNATCAGGNNSTFVCNAGYYKNGTSCSACESGATSPAGSTAHTACCYPVDTTFSDTKGSGKYGSKCCYTL